MSKQSSLFSFFGAKKTKPKAEPVKRECCVLQTATVKAPAPIGSFFLANSTIEGKGWETAAFVFQFSNVMWPREVEGAGHRQAPGRTVSWNLFRRCRFARAGLKGGRWLRNKPALRNPFPLVLSSHPFLLAIFCVRAASKKPQAPQSSQTSTASASSRSEATVSVAGCPKVSLNDSICIYWPQDRQYYECVVTKISGKGVVVRYGDGEEERVVLSEVKWKTLDAIDEDEEADDDDGEAEFDEKGNDSDDQSFVDKDDDESEEDDWMADSSSEEENDNNSDESSAFGEEEEDEVSLGVFGLASFLGGWYGTLRVA